jgi:hypothetical protein
MESEHNPDAIGNDAFTWAALLARWMELAQAAVALERQGGAPLAAACGGGGWSRGMPALITFEALRHAMTQLGTLPPDERSFALDQATVLLESRRADLEDAFEVIPDAIAQADRQAEAAIESARLRFVWTIVWEGPGPLTMPEVAGVPSTRTDEGAVAIMLPGTLAVIGSPIAWWTGRHEPMLERGLVGCQARPCDRGLQVWRRFDSDGMAIEDRLRDVNDEPLEGGVPLLVPLLAGGHRLERPSVDGWLPADPAAMPEPPPLRLDIDPA